MGAGTRWLCCWVAAARWLCRHYTMLGSALIAPRRAARGTGASQTRHPAHSCGAAESAPDEREYVPVITGAHRKRRLCGCILMHQHAICGSDSVEDGIQFPQICFGLPNFVHCIYRVNDSFMPCKYESNFIVFWGTLGPRRGKKYAEKDASF